MKRTFDINDVAGILGRNPRTIRRWCRDGKLRGYAYNINGRYYIMPDDFGSFLSKHHLDSQSEAKFNA